MDGKSNDIPALPELFDVKAHAVTAEAPHAQRDTVVAIVANGGRLRAGAEAQPERHARGRAGVSAPDIGEPPVASTASTGWQ